jgi:hypothetical protein
MEYHASPCGGGEEGKTSQAGAQVENESIQMSQEKLMKLHHV